MIKMGNTKNKNQTTSTTIVHSNEINSKLNAYLTSKKILTMKELDQNRLRAYEPIFK